MERAASQSYPNIRSFVGKDHRVDNNVKATLTFCAPIMRQMATSSIIPPNTANVAPTPTNTETDTHSNVRLPFGEMQKNPNLKLRNNVLALSQNYEKLLLDSSCLYVCPFARVEQLSSDWTDFREI